MENKSVIIKWTELPETVLQGITDSYISQYFSSKMGSVEDYATAYFRDTLGFNVIIGRDNDNIAIVEFESEQDYMFFKLKYS